MKRIMLYVVLTLVLLPVLAKDKKSPLVPNVPEPPTLQMSGDGISAFSKQLPANILKIVKKLPRRKLAKLKAAINTVQKKNPLLVD